LVSLRPDDVNRTIAHLYRLRFGLAWLLLSFPFARICRRSGNDRLRSRDNSFHQLDRILIRRAADVAGSNVVVVSFYASEVAVDLNALHPVFLRTRAECVLPLCQIGIRWRWRRRSLAQVVRDLAAIAEWIERGNDGAAVRAFPDADIERNALGRFFRRI